jgi:hypothetical protein
MHVLGRYPATATLTVLCVVATFLFSILQAITYP